MTSVHLIDLLMVFMLGMHAGVFVYFMLTKDRA
jgi:hypothetical protein